MSLVILRTRILAERNEQRMFKSRRATSLHLNMHTIYKASFRKSRKKFLGWQWLSCACKALCKVGLSSYWWLIHDGKMTYVVYYTVCRRHRLTWPALSGSWPSLSSFASSGKVHSGRATFSSSQMRSLYAGLKKKINDMTNQQMTKLVHYVQGHFGPFWVHFTLLWVWIIIEYNNKRMIRTGWELILAASPSNTEWHWSLQTHSCSFLRCSCK